MRSCWPSAPGKTNIVKTATPRHPNDSSVVLFRVADRRKTRGPVERFPGPARFRPYVGQGRQIFAPGAKGASPITMRRSEGSLAMDGSPTQTARWFRHHTTWSAP